MKKIIIALTFLFSVQLQAAEVCTTPCFFLEVEQGVGAQINRWGADTGINFLSLTENGVGAFIGATSDKGVGLWVAGENGATALKVQGDLDVINGKIIKPFSQNNILKVYDLSTGELIGEFLFSLE